MSEQIKTNDSRSFFSNMAFVLLSVLSGVAMGLAIGAVSSLIYLVIVFPILIGILGGKTISDMAKYMKVRNASLIRSTALLTAVILFSTIFYVRFLGLHVITALELGGLSDTNLKAAPALLDYALEKETGHSGFVGYVLYKANQGVSIGRLFRNNALNLGPVFTWLYWLAELAIIAFLMTYTSRGISTQPFCENCNTWIGGKRHIGGAPAARQTEILDFIKQHNYPALGKTLEANADVPSMELYLQGCLTCDKSPAFLTATSTQLINGRLAFIDVLNATLTAHENKLLIEEIKIPVN